MGGVGVDLGAHNIIKKKHKKLAAQGLAVIVVSDDTAEVIATCDRVVIMQGGCITGRLEKSELTEQNLAAAAN